VNLSHIVEYTKTTVIVVQKPLILITFYWLFLWLLKSKFRKWTSHQWIIIQLKI